MFVQDEDDNKCSHSTVEGDAPFQSLLYCCCDVPVEDGVPFLKVKASCCCGEGGGVAVAVVVTRKRLESGGRSKLLVEASKSSKVRLWLWLFIFLMMILVVGWLEHGGGDDTLEVALFLFEPRRRRSFKEEGLLLL